MWKDMERVISRFGASTTARKLRHKYFNSNITDDLFERVWAIFSAELRQDMEKVYEKYDVDPEIVRKEPVKRQRSTMPKYPKANEVAKTRKKGKIGVKKLDSLE